MALNSNGVMQFDVIAAISLICTALFSLFYTKIRTADNQDAIKQIREVELPMAIKNVKELYERDHGFIRESLTKRDTALWAKLDGIQDTQKDISKSLHRLEGKHGITD